MAKSTLFASAALAVLTAASACTVHQTTAPSLSGPSEFATSVAITATPDSINQDGGSQSSIQVSVHDANGRPASNQVVRLDVLVNESQADFGTLSARTIVTGSDGVARATYTAPPASPNGSIIGTCRTFNTPGSLAGGCITITATPSASNFQTAQTQSVEIHLTPIGIIVPAGSNPFADFTDVDAGQPQCAGILRRIDELRRAARQQRLQPGGTIPATIVQYSWAFGDGGSATGKTVTHTYTSAATFTATLTVTNNSFLSASKSQQVVVGASDAPTGDWVFSPAAPAVGDTVSFNGDGVQPAPGRKLVQFSWNFGDGATASGFQATHVFTVAGAYSVVLSVLDDAGQKKVLTKTVTVGTGNPIAVFTVSPPTPVNAVAAIFDASGTTTSGGASIVQYAWAWGDGSSTTTAVATTSHTFAAAGTYVVTLTVKDNANPQRVGVFSQNVTVQ